MKLRTCWLVGVTVVLASGSTVHSKPPALPTKPEVDGKVPSQLTQEHFQVEPVAPKALPESLPTPVSPKNPPPTAADMVGGLVTVAVSSNDLAGRPATTHGDRIRFVNVTPRESAEPPLAEPVAGLAELQLRALFEAARQYKDAVESGNRARIAECGKSLETILKFAKPTSGADRVR